MIGCGRVVSGGAAAEPLSQSGSGLGGKRRESSASRRLAAAVPRSPPRVPRQVRSTRGPAAASFAAPSPVWGALDRSKMASRGATCWGWPHPLPLPGGRLPAGLTPRAAPPTPMPYLRGLQPPGRPLGCRAPRPHRPPPSGRALPLFLMVPAPGPPRPCRALRCPRAPPPPPPRAAAAPLAFPRFLKDNSSVPTGFGHGFPRRFWRIFETRPFLFSSRLSSPLL